MAPPSVSDGSNRTDSFSVAKLTAAFSTPAILPTVFSMTAAHDEQVMPVMPKADSWTALATTGAVVRTGSSTAAASGTTGQVGSTTGAVADSAAGATWAAPPGTKPQATTTRVMSSSLSRPMSDRTVSVPASASAEAARTPG